MNHISKVLTFILIGVSSIAFGTESDSKWQKMVSDGEALLHEKKPQEAIEKYFNPVIDHFNSINSTNSSRFYCARDSKETLVYLMQAAVRHTKEEGKEIPEYWGNRFAKKKDSAEVLAQFWAEAFFLKAYALVELGKISEAKTCMETAVGLSPVNSMYLAELGHIYQVEKNWDMALQAYKTAGGGAIIYSHSKRKEYDQVRAWRGEGFALIELGKLDEAITVYQKCLELNPNDKKSLAEIKYINNLKKKQNQKK